MPKTVALFPAHPAQLWLMLSVKSWIEERDRSIRFKWFFRDKDITLSLARSLGLEGVVVSKASSGFVGNAIELCLNIFRCFYYTKKFGIDLWLTKYGCGNIAARISRKKSISFNDDDEDVVPLIARTSYPFADLLLFPIFTRNSKFKDKSIYYRGLHELAYLSPNCAEVDVESPKSSYAFIRISALTAHHDVGHEGISEEFLDRLIELLQMRNIEVNISSESRLPSRFLPFIRKVNVADIHDVLRAAHIYIGDSQTMAIEACLLGVPTFRISDFGNLSVINYLESFGLINSFLPGDLSVLEKVSSLLDQYDKDYELLKSRVGEVRSSFDDTREVFGKAVLSLLDAE